MPDFRADLIREENRAQRLEDKLADMVDALELIAGNTDDGYAAWSINQVIYNAQKIGES